MKLKNKQNSLELLINDALIENIGQIALKHYPNEFGGFLIGCYSNDFKVVEIKDILLPKKYNCTPTLFERSIDSMEVDFELLFKEKNQYYIGEWHTHPNGTVMYSHTDLVAMIETVECTTVSIRNPILLILSLSSKIVKDYTFYFYNQKKLIPYE